MAVTINSSLTGFGTVTDLPQQGTAIRGLHWRTIAGNVHMVRARLPDLGGFFVESTQSSATYEDLLTWQARLSANSSETVQLEVWGQNIDVKLTITDGVDSVNGTASVGGTEGSATLNTALTAAPLSGGAGDLLTFTLEWRASSGTATLNAARVFEVRHTAATLT